MKSLFIKLTNHCGPFKTFGFIIAIVLASQNSWATTSFTSQIKGKGQPVILIPGLMSNGSIWEPVTKKLAETRQVHVVSLAGFAGTPKINDQSLTRVKSDLILYIKKHKLNKPVIIGHSLGGFMALWLASSQPKLVGSVISVDGLPFIGPIFTRTNSSTVESLSAQANMIRSMYSAMSKEQLAAQTKQSIFVQATAPADQARVIEMAANSDPYTVGDMIYQLLSTDIRADIAKIESKSLLIGASGAFTTEQQHQTVNSLYQQQLKNAANVSLIMNTNDRHFIMLDNPEWLINQIQSFLSEKDL